MDERPQGGAPTEAVTPGAPRIRRRRVTRWLRILVPSVGLVLLVIVTVWPLMREKEPGFTLSFTDIKNYDDRLRMEELQFEGTDSKNRPFILSAVSASQKTGEQDAVELNDVAANVTLEDGTWLNLEAGSGVFRDRQEELSLTGAVNMYSSRGYEVHGQDVTIDLAASRASSDQRINGQGPLGVFEASSFETDLKTENLILRNNVKMTIYPEGGKEKS